MSSSTATRTRPPPSSVSPHHRPLFPGTPGTPGTPGLYNNASKEGSTTTTSAGLSSAERRYIVDGCRSNIRIDGRTCLDRRPYSILSAVPASPSSNTNEKSGGLAAGAALTSTILSNGSSRVTLPGRSTEILCSTKAELVRPSPNRPNEGLLEVRVDLLENSGSSQERNRKEGDELSRLLSSLVSPHAVNVKGLCVLKGKYVWRIHVDLTVVGCDGCALDVCSLAMRAALRCTILPLVIPVIPDGGGNDSGGGSTGNAASSRVTDDLMIDSDHAGGVVPSGADDCPVVVTVHLLPRDVPFDVNDDDDDDDNVDDDGNGGESNSDVNKIHGKKLDDDGDTVMERENNGDTDKMWLRRQIQEQPLPSSRQRHPRDVPRTSSNALLILDSRACEERCSFATVSVSIDRNGNVCGVRGSGTSKGAGAGGGGTIPIGRLDEIRDLALSCAKGLFEKRSGTKKVMERGDTNDDESRGNGGEDVSLHPLQGHIELQ